MLTLDQALVDFRSRAGLSQAEVAAIVDVARPIISLREHGARRTPAEDLAKLSAATGFTIASTPAGWQVLDPPDPPADPWRDEPASVPAKPQVELMVFGHVSAGPGILNEEDGQWLDMIEIWRRHIDGVAQVSGDSMEPLLREGDWVGVRLEEDMPRYGDIAVFRNGYNHEVQIKVWGGIRGEEATLLSLNPTHGPVHRRLGELQILGVAYGLLRSGRLRAPW